MKKYFYVSELVNGSMNIVKRYNSHIGAESFLRMKRESWFLDENLNVKDIVIDGEIWGVEALSNGEVKHSMNIFESPMLIEPNMVYIGYEDRGHYGVPMYKNKITGEIFYDEDDVEQYTNEEI